MSDQQGQAGAAAPDVERLIERINVKLNLVKQALRDNEIDVLNPTHHAAWSDIEELRDALSAALAREAVLRTKNNVLAFDRAELQDDLEALRAENERLREAL